MKKTIYVNEATIFPEGNEATLLSEEVTPGAGYFKENYYD